MCKVSYNRIEFSLMEKWKGRMIKFLLVHFIVSIFFRLTKADGKPGCPCLTASEVVNTGLYDEYGSVRGDSSSNLVYDGHQYPNSYGQGCKAHDIMPNPPLKTGNENSRARWWEWRIRSRTAHLHALPGRK